MLHSKFQIKCIRWVHIVGQSGCHSPSRQRIGFDGTESGTFSISKMKTLARSYMWWPKIDDEFNECYTCQERRKSPVEAPLHP